MPVALVFGIVKQELRERERGGGGEREREKEERDA